MTQRHHHTATTDVNYCRTPTTNGVTNPNAGTNGNARHALYSDLGQDTCSEQGQLFPPNTCSITCQAGYYLGTAAPLVSYNYTCATASSGDVYLSLEPNFRCMWWSPPLSRSVYRTSSDYAHTVAMCVVYKNTCLHRQSVLGGPSCDRRLPSLPVLLMRAFVCAGLPPPCGTSHSRKLQKIESGHTRTHPHNPDRLLSIIVLRRPNTI